MKKYYIAFVVVYLLCLNSGRGQSQVQAQQPTDTTTALPQLEIPEITIVGKKAITLPFARKGEIYDVNIFQAPPPDSSLLGERLATAMPVGLMPRDEEKRVPLHASVEGAFGSFSSGKLRAYLDYEKGRWNFSGNTGFVSTEGHVDNSNGTSFDLGLNAQTLISTDNDILKTLRFSSGISLSAEKYGMFAFSDVKRSRSNFTVNTSLASLDRRGIAIDLGLETKFTGVTDSDPNNELKISTVSPKLTSAVAMNIGKARWTTNVAFNSISLDYSTPTQSVTLFDITSSAHWQLAEIWSATLGFVFNNGSDYAGTTRTLALPTASIEWKSGNEQYVTFWWRPKMQMNSYDYWTAYNPYLFRELPLQPEREPINLGVSFAMSTQMFNINASLSYSEFSNKSVIIHPLQEDSLPAPSLSASSNRALLLTYFEASQTRFEINAVYKPTEKLRLSLLGCVQPTYATGLNDQLPMTPLITVNAKIEYDLPKLITLWASVDSWSNQNAILSTTTTLLYSTQPTTIDGAALLNIGASTTIVPRTELSVFIHNVLDQSYDWWANYRAPGLQFSLEAKVNLK